MNKKNIEEEFLDKLENRVYRIVKQKIIGGCGPYSAIAITKKMTPKEIEDNWMKLKKEKGHIYYIANYKKLNKIADNMERMLIVHL